MSYQIKLTDVWGILPVTYRKKTIILLGLTLIGTLLEVVGIGLVVPLIALMADENFLGKYPVITELINVIGSPAKAQLVIYGMLLLLGAYVIKGLYLAFLSWKQAKYVFGIKTYLSDTLFENYLRAPYEFHLQQNSGYLIRNLTVEVHQFVYSVLNPLIILTVELTVIIALACMLFFFEPASAFFLFSATIISMYVFQLSTRNYLQKWGKERQREEGYKIQKAQEGLAGVKDIKLLGQEYSFVTNYSIHNRNASLVERKQYTLSHMPQLWLETVGAMGLTLLVIITVQRTNSPADIVPIIALFSAAAFRILPSAKRILNAIQSLRYSAAVIDLMANELNRRQSSKSLETSKINFNNTIELERVYYAYPKSFTETLSDINLKISKGQCIGIIGASGAGKSTLVDVMLGLLQPKSGSILVDGVDINTGMRSWRNQIGYVQQSIFLTDDSLRRNIAFGLKDENINEELIKQAIKAAQLESFISTLPQGLDTFVGERGIRLSGGQIQRIGIARALYHNPPVLVFDEATSALDSETEMEVMDSIKSMKGARTLIIIAHRLSTIDYCDKVYRLENGRLS